MMNSACLILATLAMLSNDDNTNSQPPVAANTRVLFDFDRANSEDQWQIVNDGVMGGLSTSRLKPADAGQVQFSGNISLKNNGGFASVRSKPQPLNLRDGQTIVLRILGDGRTYKLNLYVPDRRIAFSFQSDFETRPDEWVEIRLPLSEFQATSFGRRVSDPLKPDRVNSLGLMLADKKAGDFALLIDCIKVE